MGQVSQLQVNLLPNYPFTLQNPISHSLIDNRERKNSFPFFVCILIIFLLCFFFLLLLNDYFVIVLPFLF